MAYEPNFDIDFRRGLIGEELAGTFLSSLAGSRVEVKTDFRARETGNVYVETWQYRKPDQSDKRPSGINVSSADYWCLAGPDAAGFVMVRSDVLKRLLWELQPREACQPIVSAATCGSVGRLLPVTSLVRAIGLLP